VNNHLILKVRLLCSFIPAKLNPFWQRVRFATGLSTLCVSSFQLCETLSLSQTHIYTFSVINAVSADTQSLTKGSVYSWTLLQQHRFMQHLVYNAKHPDMPISSSEGTCCTVLLNVTDMWAPTAYQCHANHGSYISSQDQHHFETSATRVFEKVNPSAHSGRYTHSRSAEWQF